MPLPEETRPRGAPVPPTEPERTMGGYKLIREVGHGAMGEVWLGLDPRLDRYVAIKMMRCEIADDPTFIERFHREAKAIAKLSHNHITQIYTIGEEEGILYFAMEWVDGQTLSAKIREVGAVPRKEALRIIMQAADALDYACKMGVIHRDIKPGNIMLDKTDRVKVADFGLAKLADHDGLLTSTGTPVGSPSYMSPEACRGEHLDHRSDIYSLGVTFFQMLEGQLPYSASTPMSIMFKQVSEPLPEPPALKMLDYGMWMEVLRKMTAKSPEERFQTYGQLRESLERIDTASAGVVPAYIPSSPASGSGPSGISGVSETVTRGTALSMPTVGGFSSPTPTSQARTVPWKWIIGGTASAAVVLGGIAWSVLSEDDVPINSPNYVAGAPAPPVGNEMPPQHAGPGAGELSSVPMGSGPPGAGAHGTAVKAFIEQVSPAAAAAYAEYDFNSLHREIQQALNAGSGGDALRQSLQSYLTACTHLANYREGILAGAAQRPNVVTIADETHGNISLTGGTATGPTFSNAQGQEVRLQWKDVAPGNMLLLGEPFSDPGMFRNKADSLVTLYPAAHVALPHNRGAQMGATGFGLTGGHTGAGPQPQGGGGQPGGQRPQKGGQGKTGKAGAPPPPAGGQNRTGAPPPR